MFLLPVIGAGALVVSPWICDGEIIFDHLVCVINDQTIGESYKTTYFVFIRKMVRIGVRFTTDYKYVVFIRKMVRIEVRFTTDYKYFVFIRKMVITGSQTPN